MIYSIIKRAFDFTGALLALIVLSPIFLLTMIGILISDWGPIFYKANRIGKGNKPFRMYKFRSMTVAHSGSSVSVAGESRITPLGATLRRYKLDELPELWNVLKGDMSFVGPRPDVPGYADQLQGRDRDILRLKPGITGPASLKYRDEEELLAQVDDPVRYNDEVIYPDKIRLNLYYLDHYSFVKDIQMILCTLLGKRMMFNGEMI